MPNTTRIRNILLGSGIGAGAGATSSYARSKNEGHHSKTKDIIKDSIIGGVSGGIGGGLVGAKRIQKVLKESPIKKSPSKRFDLPVKKNPLALNAPKEIVKTPKKPSLKKDLSSFSDEYFSKIKYYERLNKHINKSVGKIDSPDMLRSIQRSLRKKYHKEIIPAFKKVKLTDPRSSKVSKVFKDTPETLNKINEKKIQLVNKKKSSSGLNNIVNVGSSYFFNPNQVARQQRIDEVKRMMTNNPKAIPFTVGVHDIKTQHDVDRAWSKNIKELQQLKHELTTLQAPKQDISLVDKMIAKNKAAFTKFRSDNEYLNMPAGGDMKYRLKKKYNRLDYDKFARVKQDGMEKIATQMSDIPGTPPWIQKMLARKKEIYKTAVERMKNNMA